MSKPGFRIVAHHLKFRTMVNWKFTHDNKPYSQRLVIAESLEEKYLYILTIVCEFISYNIRKTSPASKYKIQENPLQIAWLTNQNMLIIGKTNLKY